LFFFSTRTRHTSFSRDWSSDVCSSDLDLIEINKNDGIAQVVLQIRDQEGNDAFLAENEITCHILGDVRLLGMEAGNNTDMADYTDNRQRVFHGKMIVYLQAKPESTNSAFVKFSSAWLDAAELEIKFK